MKADHLTFFRGPLVARGRCVLKTMDQPIQFCGLPQSLERWEGGRVQRWQVGRLCRKGGGDQVTENRWAGHPCPRFEIFIAVKIYSILCPSGL
jgi:hypothetical protein